MAGGLNAKNQFWISAVLNPSGEKLLEVFDSNESEIAAPQCQSLHPARSGDVLDIVVSHNIQLADIIVSYVLDSDHLPVIFHILDHIIFTDLLAPLEKFADWELF